VASGGAGALLLRAAALGGLTAAAWLLGGIDASASPEEPPSAEVTIEVPRLLEDPAGWAKALTDTVLERHQARKLVPPTPSTEPQHLDVPTSFTALQQLEVPTSFTALQQVEVQTSFTALQQPKEPAPSTALQQPKEPAPSTEPQQLDEPEADNGPVLDFTGGSQTNTRSGTVTNQAPPEVVKAKAEARAAAKAAKAAAEAPPPPPPPPPAPVVVPAKKVVPQLPALPVVKITKTEPAPASDLNWSAPGPLAPLPAPQQAPVVATASASSGHTDNSGGTRGVLAVLTSHNSLFPPATWSVEERRDGRSPGSLPGLPSTSPD
jgi:hypothetical protein